MGNVDGQEAHEKMLNITDYQGNVGKERVRLIDRVLLKHTNDLT